MYQPLTGDGEIKVLVERVENMTAAAASQAGLMIREQLTTNSRHITLHMTPGGIGIFRRLTDGGSTEWLPGGSETNPYWLKLVRTGNNFMCYKSSDGQSWVQIGQQPFTIVMNSNAYIGLISYSHDTTRLNKSFFSQLRVIP